MSDAKSGFGRIKDAVGLRGHSNKGFKDEEQNRYGYFGQVGFVSPSVSSAAVTTSPGPIRKTFTWNETPSHYHNGTPKVTKSVPELALSSYPQTLDATSSHETKDNDTGAQQGFLHNDTEASACWNAQAKTIRHNLVINDPSVAGSNYSEGDLEGPLLEAERNPHSYQGLLHRRHSISTELPILELHHNDAFWPHRMSFGDTEEAILLWKPLVTIDGDSDAEPDSWASLQKHNSAAEDLKRIYEKLVDLQDNIGLWVENELRDVETLEVQVGRAQEESQTLLYQLSDSHNSIKKSSWDIIEDERAHAMETLKEVDILAAKLEYEINTLLSKAEDVEVGVTLFERQVIDLESKAIDVEEQLKSESWPHYIVRTITGIGTGPPATMTKRQR